MKILFAAILLLLVACQPKLTPSAPKLGDGEAGGGTDVGSAGERPAIDHLAAWLVDSRRKIRICAEIAPGFAVAEEDIAVELRRAFGTWEDYFRIHHIYAKQPPELQFATNFTVDPKCGDDTDVRFYFGGESAEITQAKKQFTRPVAFIQPTKYRKGFIWIAPSADWKRPGRLQAILLHEIGHAYGTGHIPGTIMTVDIAQLLASEWSDTELTRVDHCRELAPCLGCTYSTPVDDARFPGAWLKSMRALPKRPIFAWLHRNEEGAFTRLQLFAEGIESPLGDVTLKQVHADRTMVGSDSIFKVVNGLHVTQFTDASLIRYFVGPQINGTLVIAHNVATCDARERGHSSPIAATFVSSENWPQDVGEFPSVYPW